MHESTSATATFLFTDIEGSTELLKAHREAYAGILAEHHRILRDAFTAHGGREIDNQGDSFFVAFTRARDAVLAAADIQRALTTHPWPPGAAVRVRMGIHTGEADLAADRYIGMSVHRAARISALAHGGQVLVSSTTAGLLEDEGRLPGVTVRRLGQYRLKDIQRPVDIYQLDVEDLRTGFPPLKTAPREPSRRRRVALAVAAILVLAAAGLAVAGITREEGPPEVLPDSLVRIDPDTLEPTEVFPIGPGADQVLVAGGFVWVMHHVLRDAASGEIRNAGDHTVTRVAPSTGEVRVVGGGLAPCGFTADPSGDVWVANCFPRATGQQPNVVRVDAETLEFEATWRASSRSDGPIRGLAYGGGSLWVAPIFGVTPPAPPYSVLQIDPETGAPQSFAVDHAASGFGWAEGYGDLWINNFGDGSLSRLHPATGEVENVEGVTTNPVYPVVDGDTVWTGDWSLPLITRVPAAGKPTPRAIVLPALGSQQSNVWDVDVGAEAVWAVTPRLGALWRIDPETDAVTEIPVPYLPSGVAAEDDAIWVTVRGD